MSISRKVWTGPPDELVELFKARGRHVEVVDKGHDIRGITFFDASGSLGFDELPPVSLRFRLAVLSRDCLYVCFDCPSAGGEA